MLLKKSDRYTHQMKTGHKCKQMNTFWRFDKCVVIIETKQKQRNLRNGPKLIFFLTGHNETCTDLFGQDLPFPAFIKGIGGGRGWGGGGV